MEEKPSVLTGEIFQKIAELERQLAAVQTELAISQQEIRGLEEELSDVEAQYEEVVEENAYKPDCTVREFEEMEGELAARMVYDRLFDLISEPETVARMVFARAGDLELRDYLLVQLYRYQGSGLWSYKFQGPIEISEKWDSAHWDRS